MTTGSTTTCFRWRGGKSTAGVLEQHRIFRRPQSPFYPRMRRLLALFPGASGQTLRFRPDAALEFQIQTVADGRVGGPRWPDGTDLPAERVAEVRRVIDAAEKGEPVGVVYLRRVRAPSSR